MNESARYAKIVEWSDEDGVFIGSCPGLFYGGCHGDDERAVFDELLQIVEEVIESYKSDGDPLPPPTANLDLASKVRELVRQPSTSVPTATT